MKSAIIIVLLILAACPLATAQTGATGAEQKPSSASLASEELNKAARAYKAGRFSDAETHSRRALELDPENRLAPFFLARAIHSQYKPDVKMPENLKVAEKAIEAYRGILSKDAGNDEAFKATAFLLKQIGKEDELKALAGQRAVNQEIAPEKRAEAYIFLASLEWVCSFRITERKENYRNVMRNGRVRVVFRKPKKLSDFYRAKQCAERGLELLEAAIQIYSEEHRAWGYKTNLLLEMSKLAEMDGDINGRDAYRRQADDAQRRTTELLEKAGDSGKQESESAFPTPSPIEDN